MANGLTLWLGETEKIIVKHDGEIVSGFSMLGYIWGEVFINLHFVAFEKKCKVQDLDVYRVCGEEEVKITESTLKNVEILERINCFDLHEAHYPVVYN